MANPFLQCRVTPDLRARAVAAADDCDVELGTWLRLVVEDALDAHEDVELVASESRPGLVHEVRRTLGTCTCDGFVNAGHCWHLSPLSDESEAPSEDYVAELEAAAAQARAALVPVPAVVHPDDPSNEEPKQEPLSQRDCPHLPQWCAGGRCRCGLRVGRRAVR